MQFLNMYHTAYQTQIARLKELQNTLFTILQMINLFLFYQVAMTADPYDKFQTDIYIYTDKQLQC